MPGVARSPSPTQLPRGVAEPMNCRELSLSGLKLITPTVRHDARGFFLETYRAERYHALGIRCKFEQDNHSRSKLGTVRGMHFQRRPGQAKLVRVVAGRIWDVAVDIRPNSPTFGRYEGVYLDAEAHEQLYVPVGFAHGFCVVSEAAEVLYKCSAPYDAAEEAGFAFNDPDVGIVWPVDDPVFSARDAEAPRLQALRDELVSLARVWASA